MSESGTFRVLVLAFVGLTGVLLYSGAPLRTDAAPLGIVSLQLAGSAPAAASILDSWQDAGREAALLNLVVDYPYLVTYAALLSLLCRRATRSDPRLAALGRYGAATAWIAAGCDALENVALLVVLLQAPGDTAALASLVFASIKFALLGLVIAGLLIVTVRAKLIDH